MSKLRRIPEAKREVAGSLFGVSRHLTEPAEPVRQKKFAKSEPRSRDWERISGATRAPHTPFIPQSAEDMKDLYTAHDVNPNGIRRIADSTSQDNPSFDPRTRYSNHMYENEYAQSLKDILMENARADNIRHAEEQKQIDAAASQNKAAQLQMQNWLDSHLQDKDGNRISADNIMGNRIRRTATEDVSAAPFGVLNEESMRVRDEQRQQIAAATAERKASIQRTTQTTAEKQQELFSTSRLRSETMQRRHQDGAINGRLSELIR